MTILFKYLAIFILGMVPQHPVGNDNFGNGSINLANGLVGYWKFEDGTATWADSANTNTMTGTGFIGRPGSTTGKKDLGSSFDWTNDQYLYHRTGFGTLDIRGSSDWTIRAWVYYTGPGTQQETGIVAFDGSGGDADKGPISFNFGSDFPQIRISSDGTNFTTAISPRKVQRSRWHYLIAWKDSSKGKVFVRVDNFKAGSANFSGVGTTNFGNVFLIGAMHDGFNNVHNGVIDEVAIWNRALNGGEQRSDYKNSAGRFYGTDF